MAVKYIPTCTACIAQEAQTSTTLRDY